MRCNSIIGAVLALISAWAIPAAAAAQSPSLAGLTLEEAIAVFEQQGLRVFYSSDLVRPWMRVEAAPQATDPATALAEILAPEGLMLRRGLQATWLVVRAPAAYRAEPTAAQATSALPDAPTARYAPPPLEEIVVTASRYEIHRDQTASRHMISDWQLEYLPDIGEDAIRAVARLPGMASNGLSALANVRGGEIGETLFRLDGLRLYDPFHLKDFQSVFSAIDPRIVRSMDIYTGGYPATFGDRMSGVIDVETIPAPEDLYHEIGLSFFNTSLLSSGVFGDSRGHWIGSFRRSNLDVLYDRFSDLPERPRYTDVFAKLGYEINDKLTITGNLLRAEDHIQLSDDIDREERASATQHDAYIWLRLDHRLGGRTRGTTLLSRTRLESNRNGTSAKEGVSEGWLSDVRSFSIDSLQSEWYRLIGARASLGLGGVITRVHGRYDYEDEVDFDLLFDFDGAPPLPHRSREIALNPDGRQLELYTTLHFDWTRKLATEFGLRWNRQEIDFEHDATIEPRLGVRIAVSDKMAVRASWGRYYQSQAINELQVSDGVDRIFAPQKSDHLVVGFDRSFDAALELRVEAYEKSMRRLRPRFENLLNTRVLLPELKPDRIRVAPDRAKARGIEAALDGSVGPFQWWTALSWARVEDYFATYKAPRSWDQVYALSTSFSWDTPKWNLSAGAVYRSGWPTTLVRQDPDADFPTAVVVSRNSERMHHFSSLDLRLSRKIALEHSSLTVSLEIANVTNRDNPCCVEYEIGDEGDAGELVLDDVYYLPTIPSVGILWKF